MDMWFSISNTCGVRSKGSCREVWDGVELELAWNYPRPFQSGVSEDLGGVR